ncbi:MAG: sialate O-acetylesterase, partial [Verrucomicrobiaceae bacterium]|nr:sialate O-acetylesterase [Verrucomicrobiaceae bacterium]
EKHISDGRYAFAAAHKGEAATVYPPPLSQGGASNSHYGGNAETYMNVGLAMGQAMVDLLKN